MIYQTLYSNKGSDTIKQIQNNTNNAFREKMKLFQQDRRSRIIPVGRSYDPKF